MYGGGRRRFMNPKAKKFKEDCINIISPTKERFRAALGLQKKQIKLEVEIYSTRWFTKAGTIRKNDISNKIKITEDALFEALGLDDSQVFDIRYIKKTGENRIIFNLEEI